MNPEKQDVIFNLYGARIAGNLALSADPTVESTDLADIRFRVCPARAVVSDEPSWYHRYYRRSNGLPWLSCARIPAGYVIREDSVGDFVVSHAGDEVTCRPLPGATDDEIRETFLYPVLPLVFNLRGRDGFHAAAVQIGAGVVALSGPSGAGKSTLAAYLHAQGHRIITDEFLPVEGGDDSIHVHAGLAEIRLWPASLEALNALYPLKTHYDPASLKHILSATDGDHPHDATIPLEAIYFLERDEAMDVDDGVAIETLRDKRGFLRLMEQSYRLDLSDAAMLGRQMALFTRLILNGQVKALRMGWGFDLLPQAAELILQETADMARGS